MAKKVIKKPKTKATVKLSKATNSSITFEIDDKLNVVTHARINKKIVDTLINHGYLPAKSAEDETAIQLAFVLIANDVTNQIIDQVNDDGAEATT